MYIYIYYTQNGEKTYANTSHMKIKQNRAPQYLDDLNG